MQFSPRVVVWCIAAACTSADPTHTSDEDDTEDRYPDYEDPDICLMESTCNQVVPPGQELKVDVSASGGRYYAWVKPEDLGAPDAWAWVRVTGRFAVSAPVEPGAWVLTTRTSDAWSPSGFVTCDVPENPYPPAATRYRACCYAPPEWPGFDPTTMTWFYVEEGAEPIDWSGSRDEGPFDEELCPPY